MQPPPVTYKHHIQVQLQRSCPYACTLSSSPRMRHVQLSLCSSATAQRSGGVVYRLSAMV